ncbi:MAG: hypothetical protein GXO16_07240 [Epsilonproteobacteria bacterium]|nr:hypothetical protein [Campylobacterota bacterium]
MIFVLLFFEALILLYGAAHLGLGPYEAKIVFSNPLYHFLYLLFADEVFVRLPNIFLTLINIFLFYRLATLYLNRKRDALLATLLFALLPATIGSAVVINKAPFLLFLTLLFLILYHVRPVYGYVLAVVMLFVDHSFAVLFLAMALWGLYARKFEAIFFAGLFVASLILFGFDTGGKPKSYFLDTFAVFAAIFSPLLFLYFFYAIYRVLLKERKDPVWFVSATAFFFSLALSFRQRISLIDFAPFAVVGVIVTVRVFTHSLRVRIRRHRKRLYLYLFLVVAVLLLNDALLLFHQRLFFLLSPKKHFAYRHYLGKLLAQELRKRGYGCLEAPESLAYQLRFYGIKSCPNARLALKPRSGAKKISLRFHDRDFGVFYVVPQ